MDTSIFSKALERQHVVWNRATAIGRDTLRGLFATRMAPVFFFLDFMIYPPLILYFLVVGFSVDSFELLFRSLAALSIALFTWSLAEYLVHRLVFHHFPFFEAMHHAHHEAPRALIGTPTLLSLAVFMILAYWPLLEILGRQLASASIAGLLSGYLAYIVAHYAFHHTGSSGFAWAKILRRHHGMHHHLNGNINFGVTNRLWDRIFRTLVT